MKNNKYLRKLIVISTLVMSLFGCSLNQTESNKTMNMDKTIYDISEVKIPNYVRIVGVGEASHGVKEYHQMKMQIFQNLVENNNAKIFAIEGDFGGCLKVEEYIHGGKGTAEEVLNEIGFRIYNTQELVELVEWMRLYNENAVDENKLHFYGFDMQRFDNSKEYIFDKISEVLPDLSDKYREQLKDMNDNTRLDLTSNQVEYYQEQLIEFDKELESNRELLKNSVGEKETNLLFECVNSLKQYTDVLLASDYNTTRDRIMKEKVDWLAARNYGSTLYINGHNGHIARVSSSGYLSLGEQLASEYGEGYYAIGSDSLETTFNSQTETGFEVLNARNETELTKIFEQVNQDFYYIDIMTVSEDKLWKELLEENIAMSGFNISVLESQLSNKMFYTLNMIPIKSYNALLVFKNVNPSSIIN